MSKILNIKQACLLFFASFSIACGQQLAGCPIMLLYPLFPYSGDACRRTPRSPWPSSEYHVLPHSCLASTDGEQLKKEKMSLWKERQSWSPMKLELGETVRMCTCAWMCVCLCLWNARGGRGYEAVSFWGLCLSNQCLCFCLCWLIHIKCWIDWLWWECWLAVAWIKC